MRTHARLFYALLAALWLALGVAAQERIALQASFANNALPLKLDVQVGQSRVIDFDQPYERVSVSDNKIVEVVPVSERQLLLNGLAFGQVNVIAWMKHPAGEAAQQPAKLLVFDVYVQSNLALIDNQLKVLFPQENIQLSQVKGAVVLSGSVSKPELAEQAQKLVEATGLKVNNLLKAPVLDAAQVQLLIRVAEVDRRLARELSAAQGIGASVIPAFVSASGPARAGGGDDSRNSGGFGLTNSGVSLLLGSPRGSAAALGLLQALGQRGALRQLAEPNLIAMHGHKASFQAGGEFPVPIVQMGNQGQNALTVLFKEFGIKLSFQPTILDENHIRLEIEPEVSSLDFGTGVTLRGLVIPGLRVRRAKTVLELRDGQSFALVGLIDAVEQVNLAKVPVLGDVPVLGELFKSRSFQRNETELMFLVTVKTVESFNADQLPLAKPSAAPAIEGQSGHAGSKRPPEPERPLANKAKPNDINVSVGVNVGPTGLSGREKPRKP